MLILYASSSLSSTKFRHFSFSLTLLRLFSRFISKDFLAGLLPTLYIALLSQRKHCTVHIIYCFFDNDAFCRCNIYPKARMFLHHKTARAVVVFCRV